MGGRASQSLVEKKVHTLFNISLEIYHSAARQHRRIQCEKVSFSGCSELVLLILQSDEITLTSGGPPFEESKHSHYRIRLQNIY